MLRLFGCLFLCALAAESQDVNSICQKVAARYKGLSGYRVEGSYEISSSSGSGYTGQTKNKFLIEVDQKTRKMRVELPSLWVVSNGSITWTYLAADKTYTKVDAVTNDADRNPDDAESENSAVSVFELIVRTYDTFDQSAAKTQLVREQDVKTDDGKIRCWVLQTQFANRTEKVWVDQQRYLVLRSEILIPKGSTVARIAFSIKRFDIETPPDHDFTFAPGPNDKLVDELNLPGRPAFTGKPAADFVLKDLDGQPTRLSDMRGKVVVLNFWATWCPPCREELPVINKLAAQLKDQNVVFLGINDEDSSTVKNFNKKNNYTFMTLEDTSDKVYSAYKASAIPCVFVIAKDGTIVKHFVGGRSEDELLAAIKSAESH